MSRLSTITRPLIFRSTSITRPGSEPRPQTVQLCPRSVPSQSTDVVYSLCRPPQCVNVSINLVVDVIADSVSRLKSLVPSWRHLSSGQKAADRKTRPYVSLTRPLYYYSHRLIDVQRVDVRHWTTESRIQIRLSGRSSLRSHVEFNHVRDTHTARFQISCTIFVRHTAYAN